MRIKIKYFYKIYFSGVEMFMINNYRGSKYFDLIFISQFKWKLKKIYKNNCKKWLIFLWKKWIFYFNHKINDIKIIYFFFFKLVELDGIVFCICWIFYYIWRFEIKEKMVDLINLKKNELLIIFFRDLKKFRINWSWKIAEKNLNLLV